jgi:hypothetical protein
MQAFVNTKMNNFSKNTEYFWLAEELLACQEGLYFKEAGTL